MTSRLCTGCGFVLYTPRPDTADLDAKYRYRSDKADTVVASDLMNARGAAISNIQSRRSRELLHHVRRLSGTRPANARVLDFGGGDGVLMEAFVKAGCQCDLVDYSQHSVPGVVRVGQTLSDLHATSRYDWIVCSHVIEHVAEPLQVVRALGRHLAEGGRLFVEVPMEIWGRAPLQEEPVTHINFFTPTSLRCLLEKAGFRVFRCRLGGYLHPSGRHLLAARAVACLSGDAELVNLPGCAEAERFLNPGLMAKLWRYTANPASLPEAFRHQIKTRFCKSM